MNKIKQYDVGAPFAFPAYEEDGTTKLPLSDVEEAILRFKIGIRDVEERAATILLQSSPLPDLIKYTWQEGDLDNPGVMKMEVLIRYINHDQFTSLGYEKILVESVLK